MTITFDDTGTEKRQATCNDTLGKVLGTYDIVTVINTNPPSLPVAVLTMNGHSFTYGAWGHSKWSATRTVASKCGGGAIQIGLQEGDWPATEGFGIALGPVRGSPPLVTEGDWRAPLHPTNLDQNPSYGNYLMYEPPKVPNVGNGNLFFQSVTTK